MIVATLASPYSRFAADYDATIGVPFFRHTRAAFERLVNRYKIAFQSAADVGCGTGRFARYLNTEWRVRVVGVDLSPQMLDVAASNCRESGVRLLLQDIRSLQLPRPVDLITCNFDTLNHLVGDGDLRKAFDSARRNLNRGGHFIFDMVMRCGHLGGPDRYVRRFYAPGAMLDQEVRWQPGRSIFSIVVSLRSRNSPHPVMELHRERAYSAAEIGGALMETGFTILGIHDAATLAIAGDCARRIIVVARKKSVSSTVNRLAKRTEEFSAGVHMAGDSNSPGWHQ